MRGFWPLTFHQDYGSLVDLLTRGCHFVPVAFVASMASWFRGVPLVNLPGWRWATIKQVALDRLSRSLHSDVCDSDGCCDAVLHSTISGRGSRRERAALNISSRSFFLSSILVAIVCGLRPSRRCRGAIVTLARRSWSYLLGLLAMIKCSICSYQCDN